MIYLVEIGKYSRRGNFIRHTQKAVSVADKYPSTSVKTYFASRYEGFDVRIENVVETDITGELETAALPTSKELTKNQSRITDFSINYKGDEKALHEKYRQLKESADAALQKLHKSITDRLNSLFYVYQSYENKIELETTWNGTMCRNLPIKGDLLAHVAKQGMEDLPIEDLLVLKDKLFKEETDVAPSLDEINTVDFTAPLSSGDDNSYGDIPF